MSSTAPDPEPVRLRRAALVAGVVALLTLLPFLVGRWWTRPGEEFRWTRPVNRADLAANLARVVRARDGEHPLKSPFQARPEPGGMWRPTYAALGRLAAGCRLDPLVAYHLGRMLCAGLLLFGLYRLSCAFYPSEVQRWRAWGLCAFGSGLSWVAWALHPAHPTSAWADGGQVEATLASCLLESPHLLLALWLLVEAVRALVEAVRAPAGAAVRGPALRLLLCSAAIIPDQPYLLPGLLTAGGLVLLLARGPGCDARRVTGLVAAMALGLLLTTPPLLRELWSDPGYATWFPGVDTFDPGYHLLGAAPLWLLAVLGVTAPTPAWQRRLLLAWALSFWVLIYLPVPQARRLVEGWPVALGLLGAAGLDAVELRWPRRWTVPLAMGLACAGSLHLVGVQVWEYRQEERRRAHYAPAGLQAVLRGIGARLDPDDVALASWGDSTWIPALAGCRVVHGHQNQGIPPPELLPAAAAELTRAAAERRAPRFQGDLAAVRCVVLRRDADGVLRLTLDRFRPELQELEVVWEGPAAWAEPALETEEAGLVMVPAR